MLGLRGLFSVSAHSRGSAEFLLAEEWLGRSLPQVDPDAAHAELARRYISCYGPSTLESFAAWAGISPAKAARGWAKIEPALLPVDFKGRRSYLRRDDLEGLRVPVPATGIRLLPPHDPYLLLRDRDTLIPKRALQRVIWRSSGNPGALLVDGNFTGIWNARKHGKRLDLTVQSFAPLASSTREAIEAEAGSLLPFKGCTAKTIAFSDEGNFRETR